MEEMENVIFLTDEEGVEEPFEYLDTVEYEGVEYVILTPVTEEESDELEVVILRILHEENGDDSFVTEEDADALEAVFEIYRERYEEADDEAYDD